MLFPPCHSMAVSSLPTSRSAIVCISETPGANLAVRHGLPMPLPLAPGHVLVHVVAVALNPCNWKMPDRFPSIGSVGGSDFAGSIVALSDGIETTHPGLTVGDRVCGAVHGFNPADHKSGSFSNYIVATADILLKIPEGVRWEEAAAIGGTGIATLGIAFRQYLLPESWFVNQAKVDETLPVLVYGAGTATGTIAIQLLRILGFRPLAVCSSKSAQLALSYGAEKTFDYTSSTCAADIKSYTNRRLAHVLDIIADSTSIKLCYDAMGRLGGSYVGLELLPDDRPNRQLVHAAWVMGQSIFGKALQLGRGYGIPASPASRQLGKRWFAEVQELWHRGAIKPHPVRVGQQRGLEAVIDGVNIMRRRQVAREKLVYFLQ
ncbi:putative zinc-binding dehydrogenase family oxidoreductase [Daldinia caldariorum]|uniref:putative zinc-binding dehydrogenase family oxidoreductase n=1 Tax=Daldinia caldariorum TaxID=326644 RepID=UPI002007BF13|nr:putative zinc-binding dehydrogenase family oxidoreductase [Daldinia caldariorum]KAI1464437.1 putative zinc-binding dehydrogenase family oxidoreductase [Daldinia caldariorum]